MALIVAALVALWDSPLFAALLGALIGGALSIWASLWAVSRARRLEDDRARTGLVARLQFMLESTQVIGLALPESNPRWATALEAILELQAIWEPFDSMASDLHLLRDAVVQRDLFAFSVEVRLFSRGLVNSEARFDRINSEVDAGTQRTIRRWHGQARSTARHRQIARTDGPKLAERARVLARRLRAIAP